ncbi:uncharacterized protein LOC126561198 [Anopheles maculipalpis]|uniref:uncharacterized protein LOC126561198 n=1 Tax=Anopheles maculipalpis TaxID=1496333 RepID=UPI002158B9E9|nr:uncharacterized protein LOC126561198 [Anopheles maculipalpis]
MAAYIVIPVIVLTIMAIYFVVYMYDRRLKSMRSSAAPPATTTSTCSNVRQEGGIVYTISNTHSTGNGAVRPGSELNGRVSVVPPPQYGYTNQNLIVVTTIPRDLPPSYDQAIRTREDEIPNSISAPS